MIGYNGHVYSCFAKGSQIIIYEDYKQVLSLEYMSNENRRAENFRAL